MIFDNREHYLKFLKEIENTISTNNFYESFGAKLYDILEAEKFQPKNIAPMSNDSVGIVQTIGHGSDIANTKSAKMRLKTDEITQMHAMIDKFERDSNDGDNNENNKNRDDNDTDDTDDGNDEKLNEETEYKTTLIEGKCLYCRAKIMNNYICDKCAEELNIDVENMKERNKALNINAIDLPKQMPDRGHDKDRGTHGFIMGEPSPGRSF